MDQVYIPHSLMFWLFNEVKESSFHQPSRVARAKEVRELISDRKITILREEYPESIDLGLEVGDELAVLFEVASSKCEYHSYVVRSLPIHKSGSYMEESANLNGHENQVIECCHVVMALRRYGEISESEESNALSFLEKHEVMDNLGFFIERNAHLLLDDLSVSYFQSIGLFKKLINSDFLVSVHKHVDNECSSLVKLEEHFSNISCKLESIRQELAIGLANDKVKLTRLSSNERDQDLSVLTDLFEINDHVGGVVMDDRFGNQHPNFSLKGTTIPTYTTIDLLCTLYKQNKLHEKDYYAGLITLRSAQYHIIPLTINELNYWIHNSTVDKGVLIESMELKTIRRYLLKLKMSNSIQLPRDANWLIQMLKTISTSLKELWLTEMSHEEKIARSNWLSSLLDYRGWASFHQKLAGEGLGESGLMLKVQSLLLKSVHNQTLPDEYWNWLEKYVLHPVKREEPITYKQLMLFSKQEIKRQVCDDDLWSTIEKENI